MKMELKIIGCEDVDRIYAIRNRDQWRILVNTAMNLRVP